MDLLAVSYHNIGPFKDKRISIVFAPGKHLIKAPIGTGKSFLFFDGPMFALYKYSSRNMLNIGSKNGFIKLLFDYNGQKFFVIRNLAKGKSKDTCQSTFFNIENLDVTKLYDKMDISNGLISDKDIETILQSDSSINMEEVKFKNETDLQLYLTDAFEAREVFLSTIFLMQDTDNIFEITASERLNILKDVFALIGLDESKELVADRKRDVVSKIKAYEDSSKYDDRIKMLLKKYISNFESLKNLNINHIDWNTYQGFFDDIVMIVDKINMDGFGNHDFPVEINQLLDQYLIDNRNIYQQYKHQKENISSNITTSGSNKNNLIGQKSQFESESMVLKQQIESIDPNKILLLKSQKTEFQNQQETINNTLSKSQIESFCDQNKDWLENDLNHDMIDIESVYMLTKYLINEGKNLDNNSQNIKNQVQNQEIIFQNEIEKSNNLIQNLNDRKNIFSEQLKQIVNRLNIFDQEVSKNEVYHCEKIDINCPYIKVINKKSFEQFEEQRKLIEKEKIELETKIGNEKIDEKISEIQNHIDSLQKTGLKDQIDIFQGQLTSINQKIEKIKTFLVLIHYKDIESQYLQYKQHDKNIKDMDREISVLENHLNQLNTYKLDLQKNLLQIENIDKQIFDFDQQLNSLTIQLQEVVKNIEKIDIQTLSSIDQLNTSMKENYRDIDQLIVDFKKSQTQIQSFKEEEKILSNLYQILGKEILLIVLQDSLPILNDIINQYLSQVVDFQIKFEFNQTSSDKLELEIKIYDDKGIRDVKSLSGGQRTILKLVWMLSISSFINSKILFLDETINNIDNDTVGKVSEMLQNFVKQRNMKFFVVTHSQQIQNMDIWDNMIELEKL